MEEQFAGHQFRRGAIWRIATTPDDLARDSNPWLVDNDVFAIVLSAATDRAHVRVVEAFALDPVNSARVRLDRRSVELMPADSDADLPEYVVVDCANVRTFTDRIFHQGDHLGSLASVEKMVEIDEAVVRGLGLGLYDDFSSP